MPRPARGVMLSIYSLVVKLWVQSKQMERGGGQRAHGGMRNFSGHGRNEVRGVQGVRACVTSQKAGRAGMVTRLV
jgi:hypothetical protein